MVHNSLYLYLISNCNPIRTIRVNRTKTLITGVAFISYAKTVMQFILLLGLSCKQIHA
jgi:hypothetical protein